MRISNKNTIDFDLSEIIAELEMPVTKYKPLKPLKSGNHIDDFVLIKDNMNKRSFLGGVEISSSILLRKLSGKPIVISFYSSQWREHGLDHLKRLNFLQKEIKALGANLVIITPDEGNKYLEEIIWNNSLSLNFYFDQENLIAKKFGVYSDADPAWNKYPGIEANVPLLATYVLDTGNQIIFDHIDKDLQQLVLPDELLYVLNTGNSYTQKRKSA
jgi:peroxiredoxin